VVHIWVRMARWTEDFTFDLEPGLMLLVVLVWYYEYSQFVRKVQTLF
jgi:hypothetical protein